jgi:hypothetical protein
VDTVSVVNPVFETFVILVPFRYTSTLDHDVDDQ